MGKGVISKSLAAIRKEPHETSEMVNQMLFGETFDIVEDYKGWLRIIGHVDQYHGWLDSRLTNAIEGENLSENYQLAASLFKAQENGCKFRVNLCPGSVLREFNNGSFICGKATFQQIDDPFADLKENKSATIAHLAKTYVNSPYLWGGRSPYGIDCSGLVQVVYRIAGINLPRDASQQAETGSTVDFIDHVELGDLAFFDNAEGIITHVGIIMDKTHIAHSSGYVRIDNFDHQGIFNAKANQYTHKLRVIKRVI